MLGTLTRLSLVPHVSWKRRDLTRTNSKESLSLIVETFFKIMLTANSERQIRFDNFSE